jgi:hypothetical protein
MQSDGAILITDNPFIGSALGGNLFVGSEDSSSEAA